MNPAVLDLNRGAAVPGGIATQNVLAAFTEGASTRDTQHPNLDG